MVHYWFYFVVIVANQEGRPSETNEYVPYDEDCCLTNPDRLLNLVVNMIGPEYWSECFYVKKKILL